MKKQDFGNLKTGSTSNLEKKIGQLEKEKTDALIELRMGKAKNVHSLKQIKKDIAKVKTILNAKIFIQKSTDDHEKTETGKEKNASS